MRSTPPELVQVTDLFREQSPFAEQNARLTNTDWALLERRQRRWLELRSKAAQLEEGLGGIRTELKNIKEALEHSSVLLDEPSYPLDPRLKWCNEHVDEILKYAPAFIGIGETGIVLIARDEEELSRKISDLTEPEQEKVLMLHTSQLS